MSTTAATSRADVTVATAAAKPGHTHKHNGTPIVKTRGATGIDGGASSHNPAHGRARNGKDLVIYGGGSAGGRGAMVHLDYISSMLGHRASANVKVVGFIDSALWIDAAPFRGVDFPGWC